MPKQLKRRTHPLGGVLLYWCTDTLYSTKGEHLIRLVPRHLPHGGRLKVRRRFVCTNSPKNQNLNDKLVFICVLKFVSLSLPPWGRWQSRSRSDTFCEAKSRVTDEVLAVCTARNSISSSTVATVPLPHGGRLKNAPFRPHKPTAKSKFER